MKQLDLRLYFITDSTGFGEEEFLRRTEAALKGGATFLQLREKEKTTREYIALAEKVHELAKKYSVPLIIDDRLDVAMAVDAEGIHLGQSDMPIATARRIWGEEKIIGATAKTVAQAEEAYEQGADYLGVGAIYPTTTKVKTILTSTETLHDICRAVPIPVNAIGGLNKNNIDVLKGIPIAGICVVSAIMKAEDPQQAAEELRSQIQKELGICEDGRRVRGVIFDMDGTLLDSMALWDSIGEVYLKSLGYTPRENLQETFQEFSLYQAACYYRDVYGVTLSIEELLEGMNEMIAAYYREHVVAKPGVPEFLEQLHQAGIKMCVATATDREIAEAALKHCGLNRYFSEIFTSTSVGSGKGKPVIYREACRHLGSDKTNTVVFEDALYALKTAKQDGFQVVAVYDSHERAQEEMKQLSDVYLTDFLHTESFWKFASSR